MQSRECNAGMGMYENYFCRAYKMFFDEWHERNEEEFSCFDSAKERIGDKRLKSGNNKRKWLKI